MIDKMDDRPVGIIAKIGDYSILHLKSGKIRVEKYGGNAIDLDQNSVQFEELKRQSNVSIDAVVAYMELLLSSYSIVGVDYV